MLKTLSDVTIKDAAKGTVSAVFSTFGVKDSDGDVTLPGAIADGTEVVISSYGHQSHYGSLPVGKGVIRIDGAEAILDGQFFLDTIAGKDTFTVVKSLGGLGEWSYSLNDVTSRTGEMDGEQVTYLEKIGLIKEVSPVLMGAGVNTRTLTAKSAGLRFAEEGDAVLADVDAFLARAHEVMVLRAAKGQVMSAVSAGLVAQIDERLKAVRALIHPEATPVAPGHDETKQQGDETDQDDLADLKALAAEHDRAALSAGLFSSITHQNGA